MHGQLIPRGGGDPIPLLKTKLLIGRRSNCDIMLAFPNVSSQHCELELLNGYWHVRDLGSRNGVKVNGHRCSTKWLLPGDELSVGKHAYKVRYEASGDRPPSEVEDEFAVGLMEKAGLSRRDDARPGPEQRSSRERRASPGDTVADSSRSTEDDEALGYLSGD